MYKIIGADQKQYGPVTAEQLHQWIAEGRVNAQTQVCLEGDVNWKPLSAMPEFADALGVAPAAPPAFSAAPSPVSGEAGGGGLAAQSVKGPAIALIVTSVLNLLFGLWGLARHQATMELYSNMPQLNDPQMQRILHLATGPVGIINAVFQLLVTTLILVGAIRMMALKNYALAFTGCVLSVIPCITPCCGIITLPFGIWALVVLNRHDVKTQFG